MMRIKTLPFGLRKSFNRWMGLLTLSIMLPAFAEIVPAHTSPSNQITPLNIQASNTEILADALARADRMHLADSPYWHRLMVYQKKRAGFESAVTKSSFFLAPNGGHNPKAELDATLKGLFNSGISKPDDATACLFPVRRDWLVEQLGLKDSDLPATPCPALTQWLQGIQPQHATLVFSSDYMNNPSSMFGHTLLRLDPDANVQTRLLAYAINYSAQTDNASSASFAIKGLTGQYPGSYDIMPYYEKVKEYNDFESRDLWEYSLNLTPMETQRITKRVWELRFVSFPYYFLHSNCSYQLLGLMDVARPSLSLQDQFPIYAIPTDTLRASLIKAGLLEKVDYRPAFASRLNAQADHAIPPVINAAKTLVEKPDAQLEGLSAKQQAQASEMASDYVYHQFVGHHIDKDVAQLKLRALLIRRSQYDVPDTRVTVPAPSIDPAQGHLTSRILLGGGEAQGHGFADLEWRPAYHDLLDPAGGYRNGAGINFLQTRLRIQQDELSLQQLTLLSIDSLSPKTDFFDPLSWNLALGIRQVSQDQKAFSRDKTHAVSYVQGGEGQAWQLGSALCYGLASAALEGGKFLDHGWRVGMGPSLGCLWNMSAFSLQLQSTQLFWQDQHVWENQSKVGAQIPLHLGSNDQRQALRVSWQQTRQSSRQSHEFSLSWLRYF
ncbi:DUF4105 domain-containing protein [Aquirhabdus sp.]|uniref:Lnb N-terminal periplasmic domain-containing protein n=1 Tax=Aquirhabdus sp. TaxID=2824160 RepID=UPI00396CC2A2